MKLTCPACFAQFSLEAATNQVAARGALVQALSMPAPLGVLLPQYLALFRPKSRAVSLGRVETILAELNPMIESGELRRNGVLTPAPELVWVEAISQVINLRDSGRLNLPLKSNGYLLEVVAGLAEKAQAQKERRKESELRAGAHRQATPGESKAMGEASWLSQELSQIAGDLRMKIITPERAEELRKEARTKAKGGN